MWFMDWLNICVVICNQNKRVYSAHMWIKWSIIRRAEPRVLQESQAAWHTVWAMIPRGSSASKESPVCTAMPWVPLIWSYCLIRSKSWINVWGKVAYWHDLLLKGITNTRSVPKQIWFRIARWGGKGRLVLNLVLQIVCDNSFICTMELSDSGLKLEPT